MPATRSYGTRRPGWRVHVTNQASEQRFSPESAYLARTWLEEAVGQVSSSEASVPDLLARFNGVYLQDGTVLSWPAPLANQWPASSKAGKASGDARASPCGTGPRQPERTVAASSARAAERSGEAISTPLPVGSLFKADMGYFTLKGMGERGKVGQSWLTHSSASLTIIDERGQCSYLLAFLRAPPGDEVDVQVCVGKQERLPVRLMAVRVSAELAQRRREQANKQITHPGKRLPSSDSRPVQAESEHRRGKPKRKKVSAARLRLADWTILLTNVPQEMLSVSEALVLVRWSFQIELFWKLCKQHGKLDTWRSDIPARILPELYTKLLGLLIT
jgi:hypothetical protein